MKPRFFATPEDFRVWLAKNHGTKSELLVRFYKRDTGKPSITWPQSVDEALCFGWIDGVRRSLAASALVTAPACEVATPRVPEPLSSLDWVRDARSTERVYVGQSFPQDPDVSFDDPEGAGNSTVTIREIDLDANGICDLVVTVFDQVAGEAGPAHAVFWFADAQGWQRQGPDWGARAAGFNAISRALLAPDTNEDERIYGFGNYAPVKLPGGRIVLVVRVETGRNPTSAAPVLAWDPKIRGIAPLALDAAPLVASVTKSCVDQQAECQACATW